MLIVNTSKSHFDKPGFLSGFMVIFNYSLAGYMALGHTCCANESFATLGGKGFQHNDFFVVNIIILNLHNVMFCCFGFHVVIQLDFCRLLWNASHYGASNYLQTMQ